MRSRHLAALAALCGCGLTPPVLMIDASVDPADAPATSPDAAAPSWQVIETLIIDSKKPQAMQSNAVLAAGTMYRLRASGTVIAIDGLGADADYYDFAMPKDMACCEDIGIGIDDPMVDLNTTPDWGAYSQTHIYEITFMGKGAAISAAFQDTVYTNNTGHLTLEILALR